MKYKALTLAVLLCCLSGAMWAQIHSTDKQTQTGPWKDIPEIALPKPGKQEVKLPEKFRLLELDVDQLSAKLAKLPADFSKSADKPTMVIELPLPDGTSEKYLIYSDPIMHPYLAKQFPG